jgi:hypothetical protein
MTPKTEAPPSQPVEEGAVRFAVAEALLLADQDLSVDAGARELLRWVSRNRRGLDLAIERLGELPDDRVASRAAQMRQRALTIGLFY